MTYKELIDRLRRAEYAYYVLDDPIMQDSEYDSMMQKLRSMEEADPSIIDSNSPTQRVGGKAAGPFRKVKHPTKMLSLENAFTLEDLEDFNDRVRDSTYLLEPKLDGLTLVCHYNNGELQGAATRGDGLVGEDVTLTARTIRNLPLAVSYKGDFYARGEVMLSRVNFRVANDIRINKGLKPFANPRNAAAGLLRQKDPGVSFEFALLICFYDVFGYPDTVHTEMAKLVWLEQEAHLPTLKSFTDECDNMAELYGSCCAMDKCRENLEFDIDGMVIKANDLNVHRRVGNGTKFPHWAIAYKFPAKHMATTLNSVEWQIGRTGHVTPVAVLDPVPIAGTTVDHASLHNPGYIKELGLQTGDTVSVYKAAEIIPQVSEVLWHNEDSVDIETPQVCPCCGTPLTMIGAILMCQNRLCPDRIKAWLSFFGQRDHMDIQGLGDSVASQLVDTKLCTSPASLYRLTKKQLLCLEGFADTKAEALLASIKASKSKPYKKVLASLGVEGLGDTTSAEIALVMPSMSALLDATETSLFAINGIGNTTAKAIWEGLHRPEMLDLISELKALGLSMAAENMGAPKTLTGMSICITGTLSKDRDYYKEEIMMHGGKYVSGVSSKTTWLVAGEGGGDKRKKAASLGVKIITEEDLIGLIRDGK